MSTPPTARDAREATDALPDLCWARPVAAVKQDARRAAQLLIEEIGADGPESILETATRAAGVIRALHTQICELHDELNALHTQICELHDELNAQQSIHDADMLDAVRPALVALCHELGLPIHTDPRDGIRNALRQRNTGGSDAV